MKNLSAGLVAEWTRGDLEGEAAVPLSSASADSRRCRGGELFVALPGERTQGSLYAGEAWERGAAAVLAPRGAELPPPPPGKAKILVEDPLVALQRAAQRWRESMESLIVVGITGSNGKTTTKEILAAILKAWRKEEVFYSQGNFNSDIGLPLMILGLKESHRIAVLEMGMNRGGEMDVLVKIAQPDIALITNIGSAHRGMLGSQEAVAAEKRKIFSLADSSTVGIVPAGDPWRDYLGEGFPGVLVDFGENHEEDSSFSQEQGREGQVLVLEGQEVFFSLPGAHNRRNAQAALAAARVLGVPFSAVQEGLAQVQAPFGRTEIIPGLVTVVRDCYNMNPESLEAALTLLAEIPAGGRRAAVLGEMQELGELTDEAHRRAGEAAAATGLDGIFFFGEKMELAAGAARRAGFPGDIFFFTVFKDLEASLKAWLQPGDLVLLKGSRKTALERLSDVFMGVGVL